MKKAEDSKEQLKELVKSRMGGSKFIIVSNREPYVHLHSPKGIKCSVPAGGLTAALDPLMQAVGSLWVAGGSGDADRETVDSSDRVRVPPSKPSYTLKRVWLTKEEVENFYFGFANQTLWPLCHNVFVKPVFKKKFWDGYRHSNQLFAKAVLKEMGKEKPFVWFQDYHLALMPAMIRKKRPDMRAAHFWHIPWPSAEVFSLCPWAKELMRGLLSNDLMGFHVDSYCNNFLESADFILDADVNYRDGIIHYEGREIRVRPFPISVDFRAINTLASGREVKKETQSLRTGGPREYKYLSVGVDRIDYTKGIIERLHAIERFLEKYPEYQKKFIHVQAGAPSRTQVPEYIKLNQHLREEVNRINWKFQSGYWKPIHNIMQKIPYSKLLALYRDADVCIVSPLQDGMNLVAKEFAAANVDLSGALILSPFAGASGEMEDAIQVNPYDTEKFADSIKKALEMTPSEKKERMKRLRATVRKYDIYRWVSEFIEEATKE